MGWLYRRDITGPTGANAHAYTGASATSVNLTGGTGFRYAAIAEGSVHSYRGSVTISIRRGTTVIASSTHDIDTRDGPFSASFRFAVAGDHASTASINLSINRGAYTGQLIAIATSG